VLFDAEIGIAFQDSKGTVYDNSRKHTVSKAWMSPDGTAGCNVAGSLSVNQVRGGGKGKKKVWMEAGTRDVGSVRRKEGCCGVAADWEVERRPCSS
jgi:hypothetical protein